MPSWWYDASKTPPVGGAIIDGAARVYAAAVEWRYKKATPVAAQVPVICIGNFTAGGTGKTPLALHVSQMLKSYGKQPAFLTRGYGGREKGPLWVSPETHLAEVVGDEPMLLAQAAPVVVARDRAVGARFITTQRTNIDVIVMDDGMQNPGLKKDLVFAVVDGQRGLGNGRVIPAGPLRGDLDFQVSLADAVVITEVIGQAENMDTGGIEQTTPRTSIYETLRQHFPGPVLRAQYGPSADAFWLDGQPVFAFAGIGNPERFFDMLAGLGADVVQTRAFADHHAFAEADAHDLLTAAERESATLVTTTKDFARLTSAQGALARLREASRTVPIALTFSAEDEERLKSLLDGVFKEKRSQT